VRNVAAPSSALPALHRSVVAALASILELPSAGDVPMPPADHPEPWTVWRNWLAERGLGVVPVVQPQSFAWPGPWIALLHSHDGEGQIAAVAFGAPPGLVWKPIDGPETFGDVEAGYLVAPADVALWSRAGEIAPRASGRVEAIAVAPEPQTAMMLLAEAVARAGLGLEGDRYFEGRGTFSDPHATGNDLTLIEAEVLESLELPGGSPLAPQDARRNVVTRGIDLNALVGRRFTVGTAMCVGRRLCEPCAHLERLTAPGVLRALVHAGGLRADVLVDGVIRVGDEVVAE
jgi:MOSC domain-containing protein YiiM